MISVRRTAMLMIVCPIILLATSAHAQSTEGADAHPAPFQQGVWLMNLSTSVLGEAWNYNESREELYVLSLGLRREANSRLAFGIDAITAYVSQRGVDAFAIGWLGGVRWRVHGTRRTLSMDLDVGMVRGELRVPPRGTRFNYLFRPGATLSFPLVRGAHVALSAQWLHLSNNSLEGRGRNPDIQAVGISAGALVPF